MHKHFTTLDETLVNKNDFKKIVKSNLFIAIFGIIITALFKATVPKAAQCADDLKKCGHRNLVLGRLMTGWV